MVTAQQTVPVELIVLGQETGVLLTSRETLKFQATAGGPAPPPQQAALSNPATSNFSWTAAAGVRTPTNGNWLRVSPASGTGNAVLQVEVNPVGLPRGEYRGEIRVSSASNTARVTVVLEVSEATEPILHIEPQVFHFLFETQSGQVPRPRPLEVALEARAAVNWTASANVHTPPGGNWLSVAPFSGSGRGNVSVSVNPAGLAPGLYSGRILVNGSAGGSAESQVFLRVLGSGNPLLRVQPRALQFSLAAGVASPDSRTIEITTSTGVARSFTAAAITGKGGNWLKVTPASGTTPSSILASIDTFVAASLAAGVYTGNIEVRLEGAAQTVSNVHVALHVFGTGETGLLVAEPGGVVLKAVVGGPNPPPETLQLRVEGAASLNWSAAVSTASGGNWLTVTPASGTATAGIVTQVTLAANTASLPAGIFSGSVAFTATDLGARGFSVRVHLLMAGAATAALGSRVDVETAAAPVLTAFVEPSESFTAEVGLPVNVRVKVTDANGRAVEGASLVVNSSRNEPALRLEERSNGEFAGVFRPLVSGPLTLLAEVNSQTAAHAAVSGLVESSQAAGVIFQGGAVSAASFALSPTPIVPGSLVSLFGVNIAGRGGAAATVPLPQTINGVTVTIGGIPVPLVALHSGANDQINLQVPLELACEVVVNVDGTISMAETVPLGVSPALFTVSQSGRGPGGVSSRRLFARRIRQRGGHR